jgi:WD40 repeat protein
LQRQRRVRGNVVSLSDSSVDANVASSLSDDASVTLTVQLPDSSRTLSVPVPAAASGAALCALVVAAADLSSSSSFGLYLAPRVRLGDDRLAWHVANNTLLLRAEVLVSVQFAPEGVSAADASCLLAVSSLQWPSDEPVGGVVEIVLARTPLAALAGSFGLYVRSRGGAFDALDGKRTPAQLTTSVGDAAVPAPALAPIELVLRREVPVVVVLPTGDSVHKVLALGEPPLTLLKQVDEHWLANNKPQLTPRGKNRNDGSVRGAASPPLSPRRVQSEATIAKSPRRSQTNAAPSAPSSWRRFAFYATPGPGVASRIAENQPLPADTDTSVRQTWYYCREILLTAHLSTLGMKALVPMHADTRVGDAVSHVLKRMHISVDAATMALFSNARCDVELAESATLAQCELDAAANVYLRQKVKLNLVGGEKKRRVQANRDRRISLLPRAALQNSTRALWTMPNDGKTASALTRAVVLSSGGAAAAANSDADDDDDGDDGDDDNDDAIETIRRRSVVSDKATELRRLLEAKTRESAQRLMTTAYVAAYIEKVIVVQSLVRAWRARRLVAGMRAREAQRQRVALELRDTERSYVAGIKLLVSAYKVPLEHELSSHDELVARGSTGASTTFVTRQHIDKLFLNIEDICEQTDKLMFALEQRLQSFAVASRVGDVFVQLVPSLGLYSVYNAGYQESQSTYRALAANRKFAAFIDAQRLVTADQSKLDFVSLSIMPIQRVPRYRMLLSELQKFTAPDHPDYEPLTSALRDVAKLADDINESIRAAESDEHVRQLQRKLVGLDIPLLLPGRVFVREGVLDKVCKKDVKPRSFYLFSDMLMYANDTMGQLRLSKVFMLADGLQIGESTRERAFQIITPKKSFVVIAADNHKRADWIRALQGAIQREAARKNALELEAAAAAAASLAAQAAAAAAVAAAAAAAAAAALGGSETASAGAATAASSGSVSAPVWVSDKERSDCMLCQRRFTKLTTRRHHCRACGKLVCHRCSDHRVPLNNIGKSCRVCDKCFARYDMLSGAVRDSKSLALLDVDGDDASAWVVPSGALECVLPWLASAADVGACACVSRAWAMAVAESDDVWRALYKRDYERFSLPTPPPTGTWREALQIKRGHEARWHSGVGQSEWLLGHTAAVMCLATVATSYLASGSADGSVRLWDVSSDVDARSRCVATLEHAHGGGVLCLTATDGGSRSAAQVCSGGIDRVIRQWDADTGVCVREYEGHGGVVTHLDCGNRWLMSAAQDGQVRLWDPRIADQRQCCVQQFCAPGSGRVVALRAVNDTMLLTASEDSVVRLWDSGVGLCVSSWNASHFGPLLDVLVDSSFEHCFVVPRQPDRGIVSINIRTGMAMLPSSTIHRGRELTAAARDATKLVTASGANGGIDIMCGERNAYHSWRSVAATSANPEADSEQSQPGASLCLCITDTQLATGHANGAIRVFAFADKR